MRRPPTIVFLFTCILYSGLFVDADDLSVNIALGKPVYARADYPEDLVDGDEDTAFSPHAGTFPAVVVDLKDVYKLHSIHLHAQNEEVFGNAGINVPFTVFTWDKFFSPCDLEKHYPWTVLRKNLTFKKPGDKIVLDISAKTQYIIILPDFSDPFVEQKWLPMAEVKAFGKKISNGFHPESMDEGIYVPNRHLETRNQLLKGQGKLYAQLSFMDYRLNPKYDDIAVTWYMDRVTTMAVVREKARMIFMSGIKAVQRLQDDPDYEKLRENFRAWLNPSDPNAMFVSVSKNIKDGDILIITRAETFDVPQIYDRLIKGKNSAVVAYLAQRDNKPNRVSKLMEQLKVIWEPSSINYGNIDHNAADFINNQRGTPDDYEFNVALKSFKQFRTKRLDFDRLSPKLIQSPKFQDLIRQVLEKYHDYYTYYAPCPYRPQKFDGQTINGVHNYNKLLMLQEGDKIIPAPGVWSAPGNIHPSVQPTTITAQVSTKILGRFLPTGAYAKPGVPFQYEVLYSNKQPVYQHVLRISAQLDDLANKHELKRWPLVYKKSSLEERGQMVSPFGGPILLSMSDNTNVTIRLKNVYRHPYFDVRDPKSVDNWETERSKRKGIPYGMIAGDNMISMLDSKNLLRMDKENILWSTRFYDNIIKMIHNYRGSKFESARQEVFVSDDDISAGTAQSGYPWMGSRELAENFGDLEMTKKGYNNHFPETLGHNLRVEGMQCKNGGQVIGTVFTPVVNKYLLGMDSYKRGSDPGSTPAEEAKMIKTWKDGENRGFDLSYYTYFGRLFGPGLFGNVIPMVRDRVYCPSKESITGNLMIRNMCEVSGYDLVPLHRLWHVDITEETIKFCAAFPCLFPDDELTRQVPELVNKILKEHKRECKSITPKQVAFKVDPMRGMNTTQPQTIFITEN